ncbi:MAG: agmatinase [Nitrospinota bacterium]
MREGPRFLGAEASFEEARVVILGCPFDATASFRPGARFGPGAIRVASDSLETYSPALDADLEGRALCDLGDLELPHGEKGEALERIGRAAAEVLAAGKVPFALGGEHLISLPLVEQAAARHDDLALLQWDAHCDLREEYLGERLSHTTVMRRASEWLREGSLFQFGVRSGTREEFELARRWGSLRPLSAEAVEEVLRATGERALYLTLDLDALDPASLPGTGTPEPGGVSFGELAAAIAALRGTGERLVGVDVVELCPPHDPSGTSAVVAAKAVREILLCILP